MSKTVKGPDLPMRIFLSFLILLLPLSVRADEPAWYLMSREDGCVDLKLMVKHERLPRIPASPEDYAGMMRDRGKQVTLGLPPGFPSELIGKVVQVTVGPDKAPIFVRPEICRTLDK